MAGGEGTRAFPYSAIMEKSMLRIGGKPIVRIIVDRLLKSGVCKSDELTFCVLGKHMDDFKWEFRDVPGIKFSPKMEAVGTASHYYYAAELEQKLPDDEPVMVHYADCITEIDYQKFFEVFVESMKDCCIAITKKAKHDYSEVQLDSDKKVVAFHEKPEVAYPTWTGIVMFLHGAIKDVVGDPLFGRRIDFGHNIIPRFLEADRLAAYQYEGLWYDTGNSYSYNKLKELVARGDIFV